MPLGFGSLSDVVLCFKGELRNLVSILGRQSDNGISLEQVSDLSLLKYVCISGCVRGGEEWIFRGPIPPLMMDPYIYTPFGSFFSLSLY